MPLNTHNAANDSAEYRRSSPRIIIERQAAAVECITILAGNRQSMEMEGRPCRDQLCIPGYLCSPLTGRRVESIPMGRDGDDAYCPATNCPCP